MAYAVMRSNLSISDAQTSTLDPVAQKKVQKAAQDFEAVFLRQMISSMRKAGEALSDGSTGEAEKMSMDMAWDGLATQMAASGGIGLAKMLEPWLAGDADSMRGLESILPPELPAQGLPVAIHGTGSGRASQATNAYAKTQGKLDSSALDALADRASAATGVDSSLIRAVIQAESAGNARALSPKGAVGLMQLMPGTAKELGVDPSDPVQNVMGGAKYLASLLKRFDGDQKLALAGYNAGPGAVERHKGIPPFKETRNYVDTVLAHAKRFSGGEP